MPIHARRLDQTHDCRSPLTAALDWTTRSFTAAYFAASSAIARFSEWGADGQKKWAPEAR